MDAVSLILAALMSGAVAGTQAVATDAVKDAYQGLKSLIQKKTAGKPAAEMVLAKYEENPDSWEKPMKDLLTEIKVDQDRLIVEAAQLFLAQLKAQEPQGPKFHVQMQGGVQGIVQGDHANVTMNFSDTPKEKKAKASRRKHER